MELPTRRVGMRGIRTQQVPLLTDMYVRLMVHGEGDIAHKGPLLTRTVLLEVLPN